MSNTTTMTAMEPASATRIWSNRLPPICLDNLPVWTKGLLHTHEEKRDVHSHEHNAHNHECAAHSHESPERERERVRIGDTPTTATPIKKKTPPIVRLVTIVGNSG